MSNPLSRRAALTGVFPAAAAVILPAAALAAVLTDGSQPDAALLAMGPQLETMYSDWNMALHEYSAAKRAYFAERQMKPVFDVERHISLLGEEQLAHQRDWHDRLRAHEAHDRGLRIKTKVDDLHLRANNLGDEFVAALGPVAEFQATTMAGLKFKARMAEHDEDVADSVFRDVLALKG